MTREDLCGQLSRSEYAPAFGELAEHTVEVGLLHNLQILVRSRTLGPANAQGQYRKWLFPFS